jgi:hypothetical protein
VGLLAGDGQPALVRPEQRLVGAGPGPCDRQVPPVPLQGLPGRLVQGRFPLLARLLLSHRHGFLGFPPAVESVPECQPQEVPYAQGRVDAQDEQELVAGALGPGAEDLPHGRDFFWVPDRLRLHSQPYLFNSKELDLIALAKEGDIQALYAIGSYFYNLKDNIWIFTEKKNIQKNKSISSVWSKLAAEQGHLLSSLELAIMYFEGDGVDQNKTEAFKWYKFFIQHTATITKTEIINEYEKVAKSGFALGEYCLGMLYYFGEGVAQNKLEAFFWLEKAAKQGSKIAKQDLKTLFKN